MENILFDDGKSRKIKRHPGESQQQAIARVLKAKEVNRIHRLMKFAYPRQLESHTLKRSLLKPEDFNTSINIV